MKTFSRKRAKPSGFGGASTAKRCQRSGARCSSQPSPAPRDAAAPDSLFDAADPYGFACASSDDEGPLQRRQGGIVPPITAALRSPPQLSAADPSDHAVPHAAPTVPCSGVSLRDKQRSAQHSTPAERSYPGQTVAKARTARQCQAAQVSTAAAGSAAVGATEAGHGGAAAANGTLVSSSSDLDGVGTGTAANADPFDFLLHASSSPDSKRELCAHAEPSARTSSSGQRAKAVSCGEKPSAARRRRQQEAPMGKAARVPAALSRGERAGGAPAGRRSGSISSRQSSGQLGASLEQHPRHSEPRAACDSVSALGTATQSSDDVAPPGPDFDVSGDPLALPPRPHAIRISTAEFAPLSPLPPPARQSAAGGRAAAGAGASEPAHPPVLTFTRKGAPPARKPLLEDPRAVQGTVPAVQLPNQTLPQPRSQQQQLQARLSASDSRQAVPTGVLGAPLKHRPVAFGDFASSTQRSSGGSQPGGGSQRSSGCERAQSSPTKPVAPSMSLAQVSAPLRRTPFWYDHRLRGSSLIEACVPLCSSH